MKQFFVSGTGFRRLKVAVLCTCLGPALAPADEAPETVMTDPLPVAAGPLAIQDALSLLGEHATAPASSRGAAPASGHQEALQLFEDSGATDPVEAYYARSTKPSSGVRLEINPRDEGLTFRWRLGF